MRTCSPCAVLWPMRSANTRAAEMTAGSCDAGRSVPVASARLTRMPSRMPTPGMVSFLRPSRLPSSANTSAATGSTSARSCRTLSLLMRSGTSAASRAGSASSSALSFIDGTPSLSVCP